VSTSGPSSPFLLSQSFLPAWLQYSFSPGHLHVLICVNYLHSSFPLISYAFHPPSRPPIQRRWGNVYVRGLLETTAIRTEKTCGWRLTLSPSENFSAVKTTLSMWLCGTLIHKGSDFLPGDPICDRITLDSLPFENVRLAQPRLLCLEYLFAVRCSRRHPTYRLMTRLTSR